MSKDVQINQIMLDGIPTLKISRGTYHVGYLRASGWVGQVPSDIDLADIDFDLMNTPFHYRDDGWPCSYSGAAGWAEGATCPDGCDSARTHYANDGHPACAQEPKP